MTDRTGKDGNTEEAALAKLPKWAADRIRLLEGTRDSLQRDLRSMHEPGSRIAWGWIGHGDQASGWLPDKHVSFFAPDECRPLDTFIEFRWDRDRRRVIVNASSQLVVRPTGGVNTISLEVT